MDERCAKGEDEREIPTPGGDAGGLREVLRMTCEIRVWGRG